MRNIYTTIISLCLLLSVTAQERLPGAYVGWKGAFIELHTIGNKSQSCTLVMRADSIRVFFVEGSGTLSYLYNIPRKLNESFLGGFFKDNKLNLFLNNGENPGIHSFSYDLATRALSEHTIPFKINKKEEIIIHRLSSNNYFFYLALAKETAEFVIYKFSTESQFDTLRFKAGADIWKEISADAKTLFSKQVSDVQKTDMEGECDIETAICKRKIYVRNDSLLLLLNNSIAVTEVFSFDLARNTMKNRFIHHSRAAQSAEKEVFNSFLFRNKLYYAAASRSQLLVQVNDFYSGKIVNEFRAGEDSEINFKNTIITKEGGGFFKNKTKEITSTKDVLRKLTDGHLGITATADNNDEKIQVQIGALKEVNNYGGGGGMWVGGGSFSTPGGVINSAPIFMPTGGFSSQSWLKSARFKMLLDGGTAQHIDGEMPLPINDKIEESTAGIRIPGEGENLFVLNGNYYHIFYDKKQRELSLVRY